MDTITYMEQPPKRYTFEQPQLKEWVERHCKGKVLNLFAGMTRLSVDEFRVDIDKEAIADCHMDAHEFLDTYKGEKFDTVILDPPWSLRKSREKYEGRYMGDFTRIKNKVPSVLKDGGRVITVGYSSTGMSKQRGFAKVALCVVCHNGDHDDSFGIVEDSVKSTEDKDLVVLCETKVYTPCAQESISGIFK